MNGHRYDLPLVPPILWGGPAGPPALYGVSQLEIITALQRARREHPDSTGPGLWAHAAMILGRDRAA